METVILALKWQQNASPTPHVLPSLKIITIVCSVLSFLRHQTVPAPV